MTSQQTLYTGVSRVAWGYFFLYFNITLGNVNILPDFVGYLLFLSAIRFLECEQRDLALLRPLGYLLAAWQGLLWGVELSGRTLELPIVGLVAGAVQMYFHFQLLTDLAALAQHYQEPAKPLNLRLLRWRTLQTLLLTAVTVLSNLQGQWQDGWTLILITPMSVVYVIAGICLMATLFSLRRCFQTPALPQPPV